MTWKYDMDTGEITAPWGEVVATETKPYQIPGDVQAIAETMFREESMTSMTTDKIADYAQAWIGNVEAINGN